MMLSSSPVRANRLPRLRWWVVTLLFLVTVLNYVDRQTLSVLAPVLRDEFHMSNTDYAFVVNAFLISYTVMQAVSGAFLDWIGTKWGFVVMFVWWSVATFLHRFARGVRSLALFRFLLGMGEAGNWPAATKAIAEWFPDRERGSAMGIFNAGSSTGALLAPPLIAFTTLHLGWRNAFTAISLGGMTWLVFWVLTYRKPSAVSAAEPGEAVAADGAAKALPKPKIPWLALLAYREVWGIFLVRGLTDAVWWFYIFWLPEYLKHDRGFTLSMIGLFAWIPFLTADLGCLAGGWCADLLMRHGLSLNGSRRAVLAVSALLTCAAWSVPSTTSSAIALALIAVATFGVQSWGTLLLTLPADIFPSEVVASVSGLSGFGAGVGGVFFTFLVGYLLDKFSYTPVLALMATMHPLGFVVLIALIPTIRPVQRGATSQA
ncbi:MAG TPA: MFS transporter [Terriglobales bacterium]|nr:MFS transporter [Terriglobales bacterium]